MCVSVVFGKESHHRQHSTKSQSCGCLRIPTLLLASDLPASSPAHDDWFERLTELIRSGWSDIVQELDDEAFPKMLWKLVSCGEGWWKRRCMLVRARSFVVARSPFEHDFQNDDAMLSPARLTSKNRKAGI